MYIEGGGKYMCSKVRIYSIVFLTRGMSIKKKHFLRFGVTKKVKDPKGALYITIPSHVVAQKGYK